MHRSTPLIQCIQVRKSCRGGAEVFKDASLEVHKREIVFLTGCGGSGKSTIIRLIAGLQPVDGGHILVEGRILNDMNPNELARLRQRMGILPQDFPVMMRRTVADNVALPLKVAGKDKSFIRKKIAQALRSVGLEKASTAVCSELSESERKLTALARAVVADPGILLLDEPLANLDDFTAQCVLDLLADMHMRGTTLIFATRTNTHAPAFWRSRTVNIQEGKIIESVPVLAMDDPQVGVATYEVNSVTG